MSTQKLVLDRVEFATIKVVSLGVGDFALDEVFPQLAFDFDDVKFYTKADLVYPEDEIEDPRHFRFGYGLKIDADTAGAKVPYSVEVEAIGFFHYVGGDEFSGANRFRAVRFSGYQILHGAIREMVANLTARGRHGIWNLPARNFSTLAQVKAEEDESERQVRLSAMSDSSVAGAAKDTVEKVLSKKAPAKRAPAKKARVNKLEGSST